VARKHNSRSWLPHYGAFRQHSLDTPNSVWLLCTSDQPDAQNSTWQHRTTTTTERHAPSRIRTHNYINRAAADSRLRPRGNWEKRLHLHRNQIKLIIFFLSASFSLTINKKSQPERRNNHLASWSTPVHGRKFTGALIALVTMNEAVLNYR